MPRGVKGKKKGPGVRAGEAADLLYAINQHGLDELEILRILEVDQPPCDHIRTPCRANRKDNVACFCQLVPAETSFRKKGLWQKEQAHLDTLGRDPTDGKREESTKPSGLRNLGNTCYANAALQCLFSIPSLRNGIFAAEPKVAVHDIFRELQALFLKMQFGPRSSVDTERLAKTLGLNHSIQQDGQEFLKLLLTRVEQMLSKSSDAAARGLVQQLFRGGLSYVTTCQRCGRDSASSREVQDFYDLMPQVRGFTSLTESLAAILHADLLTGDNRYRCEFCADKVDALRHVRLRTVPPYLCLALQRFYFDPRTADKAKALDKFSFPLQLDIRQVLAAAAAGNASASAVAADRAGADEGAAATAAAALEVPQYATGSPLYDLVAILIHKGSQASSGHYVAHIKDQATGLWWRFDDETADCIGANPTAAFQGDHGSVGAAAGAVGSDPAAKQAGRSRKRPAAGEPGGDDPDYEDEQENRELPMNDDDDPPQTKPSKGGRGRKSAAQSRSRGAGRGAKRPAGPARGRSRTRAGAGAAAADDDAGDDDMARAMAASLELHNGTNGAATAGQDQDELARALAASMAEQQPGTEDVEMAAVLAESARLHAATGEEGAPGEEAGQTAVVRQVASPKEQAKASTDVGEATPKRRDEVPPSEANGHRLANFEPTAPADVMLVGESFGPTVHVGQTLWVGIDGANQPAEVRGSPDQVKQAAQVMNAGQVVSTNAYMLVYRAVGFSEPPVVAEPSSLPDDLQATVSTAVAAFEEQCDVYQRQRHALKEQLEARQRAVREIMSIIIPPLNAAKQQQPQQPPQPAQEQAIDLTGPSAVPASSPGRRSQLTLSNGHAADVDGHSAPKSPSQQDATGTGAGSRETVGYWVASAWLERWANDEGTPAAVDNSSIVCTSHGAAASAENAGAAGAQAETDANPGEGGSGARGARLDPRKVAAAKLVSPQAWKRLQEAHGGGPTLAAGDVCRECLANHFNAALLGSQADVVRARVAALLEDSAASGLTDEANGSEFELETVDDEELGGAAASGAGRRFWVSRTWLQGWSKRQGASVKAEKSPTADIACPHGQLLSATITKTARRVAVPGDVWCFLRDLWRQQRIREAQEALIAGAAGTAKSGRKGRAASRSGSATAAAVDCLDLTGDDLGAGRTAERITAAAASTADVDSKGAKQRASEDDDNDDDVIEVVDRTAADAQAASVAPSSREATAEVEEVLASGAPAEALPPPPAVPTPQELDALCPELQVGRVHECRECRVAAGQAAEAQADTKRQLDAELKALGGLTQEVVPTLEQGSRYYLVPSAWVREWQNFVRRRGTGAAAPGAGVGPAPGAMAGGGSSAAAAAAAAPAARPGSVTDAMLRVLCPCHPSEPRLGVPAPRLTYKRNKLVQQEPDQDPLRIVHPEDWRQLCRLYGAPGATTHMQATSAAAEGARRTRRPRTAPERTAATINLAEGDGGVADVEAVEAAPSHTSGSAEAAGPGTDGSFQADASVRLAAVLQGFTAQLVPQQASAAGGSGDGGAGGAGSMDVDDLPVPTSATRDRATRDSPPVPELCMWPPVCPDALAAHSRAVKEALLSYRDVEVMVELVPQDELEGVFRATIHAPERKSKRSRKGRIALTVSNTTTLEQLKLQVYENLSIHPRNQALYVRGEGGSARLLEGDDLSLAQHEVLPGEEIRLVRQSIVDDDDDVTDLLGGDGRGKRRQVEEGFKNTALHGDLPQQQRQQQPAKEAAGHSEAATRSSEHQSEGVLSDG